MTDTSEHGSGKVAAAITALTLDLIKLTSHASEKVGSDLESQLAFAARLRELRAKEIRKQFDHVLKARISWWNVIERPFHVVAFVRLRRKFDWQHLPLVRLKELDALLACIEFGIPVPQAFRTRLRQWIREGTLTPREARRLTRSSGCKVGNEQLLPCPASKTSLYIGGVTSAVFALAALVCLFQFVTYIVGQCDGQGCGALGSLFIFVLLTMLSSVCSTVTWGRTLASKTLAALLEPCGDYQPPRARPRFQALLSLAW